MFCYQCEQTAGGKGCTRAGVCGKNEDVASLQDILILGLKGIAAYGYHARELGAVDPEVDSFLHEALFSTVTNVDFDPERFLRLVLRAGDMNIRVMALLDRAHTGRFGEPSPAEVFTGWRPGPGILVTGHDLLALHELLKQTQGRGINVYTHSEMLPAHGYPELRKFKHLAGNWGGAWHRQKQEFDVFPGAILANTNCVLIPKESYRDRLFTCGITGIEGVRHVEGFDFSPVVEKALALGPLPAKAGGKLITGFHHAAVLALADKITAAVKAGKIRRFFLIGGCDAPGPAGDYYREFARAVPPDGVILTLACGKYRFHDLDFGSIEGIPRLLDLGQCNNAYSAIRIASALAGNLGIDLNGLPLTFVVSWFEQKAVAILLSLLFLGVKGIRLGPKPPAFVSAGVFRRLQQQFDLKLIGDPKKDLEEALATR